MFDLKEFHLNPREIRTNSGHFAEVNNFMDDPFTTQETAKLYFEQWNISAEQAIVELRNRSLIENYTSIDFVNELKSLYRIITPEDHVAVIEKILKDAGSIYPPTIHVISSELGQSEMFMQRLLLAKAQERKKTVKVLTLEDALKLSSDEFIVFPDDAIYSGKQKSNQISRFGGLRPKIYVAGASSMSFQLGLNINAIKRIPTVLDIFTKNAQIVWAYLGHASSKDALLKGYDPTSIITGMNLNNCATVTAYKLPDSLSIPPKLREINGIKLYSPTPIRQYPN